MTIGHTISFRADMIDLILSGKKTVTIRPMKPQPKRIGEYDGLFLKTYFSWQEKDLSEKGSEWLLRQYPKGEAGDVMSIREMAETKLEIVDIHVARLHGIDCDIWKKDGVDYPLCIVSGIDRSYYHWQGFYGDTEYRWANNPWVWVIEFELVKGEVGR